MTPIAEAGNYLHTISSKPNITAVYQEFEAQNQTGNMYSAFQFNGGYLGFTAEGYINFSIWDSTGSAASLVEGPDSRLGGTHQSFGNEGTGYKTQLHYGWQTNVRYKLFVSVEHSGNDTIYRGWVGRVGSLDWYKCGAIRKANVTKYVGSTTFFLELFNGGSAERDLAHTSGCSVAWLKNNDGWTSGDSLKWTANDPDTLHKSTISQDSRFVYLSTQRGNVDNKTVPYFYDFMVKSPALEPSNPAVNSTTFTFEHNSTGKAITDDEPGLFMSSAKQAGHAWKLINHSNSSNVHFDNVYFSGDRLHATPTGDLVNIADNIWSGPNTQWQLVPVNNYGWYYIIHQSSGMKLHYNGGDLNLVEPKWNGPNVQWTLRN